MKLIAAVAVVVSHVALGQIEGSDLEWVNATRCDKGYYFDSTTCACAVIGANCPNDCNGHGTCDYSNGVCNCDKGWGSESDVSDYKALDCSLRTCPSGISWGGVADSSTTARTSKECSGVGTCNKLSGECKCRAGFSGEACELSTCPNDCSGRGKCITMSAMAELTTIAPFNNTATYGLSVDAAVWDADRVRGCICDSSWEVGTAAAQLQVSEFYGADCSLRRCPSGDDPITDVDETDCEGVDGGENGNLCYVPCSNRGSCDSLTGVCSCHVGFAGHACGEMLSTTSRRV